MPESTQAVQVEPAAQQPGRVGGKPLEAVGHRGQVGRLVVTDRCPLAEPLLVRAGLGTKGPGLRVGVHRDDPAVGEHRHRRLIGWLTPPRHSRGWRSSAMAASSSGGNPLGDSTNTG